MHPFDGFESVVRVGVPLSPLVWFRLGGPARYFASPQRIEEMAGLLKAVP